jgi:hypothetical protein
MPGRFPPGTGGCTRAELCGYEVDASHAKGCAQKMITLIIESAKKAMDAESKEHARDYLAADLFLSTVRLSGTAGIERLPKETLRRARRFLVRAMADHLAEKAGARLAGKSNGTRNE